VLARERAARVEARLEDPLGELSGAVGLTGLFQLVPLVVLGLYGGALIDRFDRRKVALIATVGLWASTLAFVLQSLAGADSVALLYAIIAVQSGFFAVANPARQAIVPRLVPLHLLPAANALNTLTWGLAFTIGPVIAGFLIAGTGTVSTVYLLDLVVFGIAVWAMWRLPSLPPEGVAPNAARGWRSVLEAIWHDLRSLVEIRKLGSSTDPLLDPLHASIARERVRLSLEAARLQNAISSGP
jgi:MFS family permease